MTSQFVLAVAMLIFTPFAAPEASLPTTLDLEPIRGLVVQHDGRWPPLDTLARETIESATGTPFFDGHDPVLLLLAWNFEPETWQHQPLISIRSAALRAELKLPQTRTVYSFTELVEHQALRSLIDRLHHAARGRKLDPLEDKVSDIYDTLLKLDDVFAGMTIRVIPDPQEANGAWQPIDLTDVSPTGEAVRSAWVALGQAFKDDNAAAFATATGRLKDALAELPAAHRPDSGLIAIELRYNRLRPWRTAWMLMAGGAALAAVALVVRRKWFDVLTVLGMLAGFVVLSYGLWLRWQIAGRIPAANMFESLLFLSWGTGPFAVLSMLVTRTRIVPLMAFATGALALFLADVLPLDSYVRPIVPVLQDTIWMSIHVPVIMISYFVLAIAMLVAHAQLGVMAFAPNRRSWIASIDSFHYWCIHVGSILLLAGIITGSMWGASSWGRYWGWDPKEVWSLIAFVGYLTILHVRVGRARVAWWGYVIGAGLMIALFVIVVPKLAPLTWIKGLAFAATAAAMVLFVAGRGRLATALKSVLCFWLILMTYLGVNYVLGTGLHSYGFGKGAVARYMLLTGGIDLAVAGVLCAIHLARQPVEPSPSTPVPVAI